MLTSPPELLVCKQETDQEFDLDIRIETLVTVTTVPVDIQTVSCRTQCGSCNSCGGFTCHGDPTCFCRLPDKK